MEERLLRWVEAHAHPVLDAVFAASHYAGTAWFGAGLVLAMAAWHAQRRERRHVAVWLILGTLVFLLQAGLKPLIARPRPELWLDGRWAITPGSFAFPSGHALMAAALYPFLAHALTGALPTRRRILAGVAALVVVWIGLGRLYLGVHWPSDVAAGWAVGLASFAAARRACSGAHTAAAARRPSPSGDG